MSTLSVFSRLTGVHLCLFAAALQRGCPSEVVSARCPTVCSLFFYRCTHFSPSLHPPLFSVQEMKICSAIINLFHLIPAAPQTLVKPLLEVVMKTERAMLIEVIHNLCSKSFPRQIWQTYLSLLTFLVSCLKPVCLYSPTRLEVHSESLWSSSWHGTLRKQWSCSWWKLLWTTHSGAACLWSDAGINTWQINTSFRSCCWVFFIIFF